MRPLLGALLLAAAAGAGAAAPERAAPEIVRATCALCHGPGIGGAPRIGDLRAWRSRAGGDLGTLARSAARGKGAMPPRGGVPDLTEAELRAAIAFMGDLDPGQR